MAQHVRCYQRGQLIVLPEDRLAALALRRRSRVSALEHQFDALGPEARQFHLHLNGQPAKLKTGADSPIGYTTNMYWRQRIGQGAVQIEPGSRPEGGGRG